MLLLDVVLTCPGNCYFNLCRDRIKHLYSQVNVIKDYFCRLSNRFFTLPAQIVAFQVKFRSQLVESVMNDLFIGEY